MQKYLDNWMGLGDDQHYIALVLKTCKAIFTRARLETKPMSAYNRLHQWAPQHEKIKGERIDMVTTSHNNKLILD